VELDKQGVPTKEVAGRLGMSDRTVRDWLKRGAFPEAKRRRKKPSSFDVFASYVWPVNNGMVEGFVTKLKLIKRQMYGRAGFALLRQRVLQAL
jgi:Helix-turn-helix domain